MSDQLARDVAAWLASTHHTRNVQPVRVTVNRGGKPAVFYGARYTQVGVYSRGMMAVTHGDKQEGDEYTDERIYLVGEVPKFAKETTRVFGEYESKHVFRLPGDDADWYLACYAERFEPWQAQYHPFGLSWMLGRWNVPGGDPIDEFGPTRKRVELAVEPV